MKKKKLLGILPSYSGGGAEKIMLMYFHNFQKRPFLLKLLVVNSDGPLKTKLVNSIEYKYKRFFNSVPKILSYIRKNKFNQFTEACNRYPKEQRNKVGSPKVSHKINTLFQIC